MKSHTAFFLALLTATAHAGPRGSTSYSIPTDSSASETKKFYTVEIEKP